MPRIAKPKPQPSPASPPVKTAPLPPPVTPPAATQAAPVPINRMVTSALVRVRARVPLGEFVAGVMTHYAPGDEFQTTSERAQRLGNQIEPV